jgi:hypothetical protein
VALAEHFDAKIRALEEKVRRDVGQAKTANDRARILGERQRQKHVVEIARASRRPRGGETCGGVRFG